MVSIRTPRSVSKQMSRRPTYLRTGLGPQTEALRRAARATVQPRQQTRLIRKPCSKPRQKYTSASVRFFFHSSRAKFIRVFESFCFPCMSIFSSAHVLNPFAFFVCQFFHQRAVSCLKKPKNSSLIFNARAGRTLRWTVSIRRPTCMFFMNRLLRQTWRLVNVLFSHTETKPHHSFPCPQSRTGAGNSNGGRLAACRASRHGDRFHAPRATSQAMGGHVNARN
jgi:hypothetical protein